MTYLLSFVFFGLAAHMLDAARHYWNDEDSFSFAWNFAWGVTSLLIGLAILLKGWIE